MKLTRNQPSAVLIFVLMTLSVIVLLTEQLIRTTMVGSSFIKTMIDREHAEMLALGGINIAIAQLSAGIEAEEAEKKGKKGEKEPQDEAAKAEQAALTPENEIKAKEETPYQKFICMLLSNLNRWQEFSFDQKIDGFDGSLKICLCSEQGKINLNNAFDFKKQEFKKEYEALLKTIEIGDKFKLGELFTKLTEFFKNRKKKLYDVTELMVIPGLDSLETFYHPPVLDPRGKNNVANNEYFLQDIFTTWTEGATIDPLVFSDSLCALFGTRRPLADDAKKMQTQFKELSSNFKKDWGTNWEENWKFLQPIYGEKPKLLPSLKDILAKRFSAKVYSVLSYGRVDKVEQRVLAIVKEVEMKPPPSKDKATEATPEAPQEQKEEQKDKNKKEVKRFFKIMKIYWL